MMDKFPPQGKHLDDTWLETFTQLRMTRFGQCVIEMANDPSFDEWTFSEKIIHAIENEVTARAERRFAKLLKASKTPLPDACIEEIHYRPDRNLNRELTSRLARCQWVEAATNLLLLGKSSVGKTYLACALVNAACRRGIEVRFVRTAELANQLVGLPAGSIEREKLLAHLVGVELLVLDDFLTTPIPRDMEAVLFNLLTAREGRESTMVTSQFEPEHWYQTLADEVIAESLMNRLIGGAEIVRIDGPNMRPKPTIYQ